MFISLLFVGVFLASPFWGTCAPDNSLHLIQHRRASINYESGTHVSVSPTIIYESSAIVEVTFSKAGQPADDDWIGVWLLPDEFSSIDLKHHAPYKYQTCSHDESYMSTSAGKIKLELINMRATMQMGLLTGGVITPTLVAVSNLVKFANPNQPLQGHLALTRSWSEMMLTWVTRDIGFPQVRWGTSSTQYSFAKNASSSTYSATDMCDSPAKDYGWIDPGNIHNVLLDNLQEATRYYYIFGSEEGGWSEERTFMSAPIPGPEWPVAVLAYGDLGHGEVDGSNQFSFSEQASLNTTTNLKDDVGDFVLHIGDISYADGYGVAWDEFFHQLQPVMSKVPYMVNPGNHESDSKNSNSYYQGSDNSGGECSVPYVNKFAMPRQSPDQPWYDFVYGNIHVVMMSTEHDFRTTSKQYADLVQMLESVNRTLTPWLILSGHRPMYISCTYGTDPSSVTQGAKLLQEHIEPILVKYKVDLALWGHHHSYQRTCPVIKKECVEDGPVHVVIGMAGQLLSINTEPVRPPYFKYIDAYHFGYSRLVTTATSLTLEYIRNIDHKIADSFSIPRKFNQ